MILFKRSPLCCSTCLVRPLLLNLNFSEALSKQQYVLLHKHNISVHLNFSLKTQTLSCRVFVLVTARLVEKIPVGSAVKLSLLYFDRNCSHSVLFSKWIQSSASVWARARYSESVPVSGFSNLFTLQKLVKKRVRVSTFEVSHIDE